ncbi:hypothetical protein INR49_009385 [Caranx melampygus]|nr:hypothetical protein INR49_009385 [Caranx melampygus]
MVMVVLEVNEKEDETEISTRMELEGRTSLCFQSRRYPGHAYGLTGRGGNCPSLPPSNKGFIPSNYVTEKNRIEANPWYCVNITRTEAEQLLRQEGKEAGLWSGSPVRRHLHCLCYTKTLSPSGDIRHYQIKISDTGQFFLAENTPSPPYLMSYTTMNTTQQYIDFYDQNTIDRKSSDKVAICSGADGKRSGD